MTSVQHQAKVVYWILVVQLLSINGYLDTSITKNQLFLCLEEKCNEMQYFHIYRINKHYILRNIPEVLYYFDKLKIKSCRSYGISRTTLSVCSIGETLRRESGVEDVS